MLRIYLYLSFHFQPTHLSIPNSWILIVIHLPVSTLVNGYVQLNIILSKKSGFNK